MKKIFIILNCLLFLQVSGQKGYTEINFFNNNQGLPGLLISDVDFDKNGDVWMSFGRKYPFSTMQAAGIAKWDGTSVTSFSNANGKLISNAVYAIACTDFNIWIGTDAGLQRASKSNNLSNSTIFHPSLTQKGLGQKITVLKQEGNNMWIGSDNGLGKLDINSNTNFTYFGGNLWGKPGAVIYSLAIGDNGDIWIGTNGGVVRKTTNNTFTVYDKSNSALATDSIYALHWKSDTKELWIGTDPANKNGVNYFGMWVLKSGNVYAMQDVVDCGVKEISAYSSRITGIDETASGEIIAAFGHSSSVFVNPKPAFFKIYKNKLSKYYIKASPNAPGALEKEVFGSSSYPLTLKKKPNGLIWLGAFENKAFEISDFSKIPNEDNNLGLLINAAPKVLDINKVSALVQNNGDMFWDLLSGSRYEVPKNSCKSPIFSSALWMGGVDNGGNLHTAAMTYRQSGIDFFPGPLDTTNGISLPGGDRNYLKIWKISSWEINEFKDRYADGSLTNGSYTPPADFISWPAHGTGNYSKQLAPFADIDNNGLYEPLKGDYPEIKGDQALYWIFNDAGNIHGESMGLPFNAEIHAMAYAYNCDSIQAGSPNEAMNYTTFYEYKIINRSKDAYDSTYFGLWTDVDLGFYGDDYVGCNPQHNFAFAYNADNDDEGVFGYGANPPMMSIVFLSDSMKQFMAYNNNFSSFGNPFGPRSYFNILRARFYNDSGMVIPFGTHQGQPTNFAYPGVPYTPGEWSEEQEGTAKGDRRFLQSAGPYSFMPGQVKTFSYAIIYSREPTQPNGLNTSWAKNMNDVNAVKNWYLNQSFPTCPTKPDGLGINSHSLQKKSVKLYPNPTTGNATIEFELENTAAVSFEVYDMLGKKVFETYGKMEAGTQYLQADLSNQPAGVYVYVLKSNQNNHSDKIIKLGE